MTIIRLFVATLLCALALSVTAAAQDSFKSGDWVRINYDQLRDRFINDRLPDTKGGLLVVENNGGTLIVQDSGCRELRLHQSYFIKATGSTQGTARRRCKISVGDQVRLNEREWNSRVSDVTIAFTKGKVTRVDGDVITVQDAQGRIEQSHRSYWIRKQQ